MKYQIQASSPEWPFKQCSAAGLGLAWHRATRLDSDLSSSGATSLAFVPAGHVTHTAQVCSENGNLEGALLRSDAVNSPER